jgi:DNA invertase Pin-like site-specific DNA recombinase
LEEYGYIRVSSTDQNEERQRVALKSQGIVEANIYMDKMSGKNFDRPGYKKVVRKMHSGDCLFIKSMDRLGRNYDEIKKQWEYLTKEKSVDIVVIDMPLLDTRQDKNLMGKFIADLVLQILAFVAEQERVNIKQRQAEGIAAAKARGVKFGRPAAPLPDNFHNAHMEWRNGNITLTKAAEMCGMAIGTFQYRAKRIEELQSSTS